MINWTNFFVSLTGKSSLGDFITFIIALITLITLIIGSVWKIRPLIIKKRIKNQLFKIREKIPQDYQQPEEKKRLYEVLILIKNLTKKIENYDFKEELEETKQMEAEIRFKLRYHVRFIFLTPSLERKSIDQITSLILYQNTLQTLFQFELGHIKESIDQKVVISELSLPQMLAPTYPGKYIEEFERIIKEVEAPIEFRLIPGVATPTKEDITRVIISESELPWWHNIQTHTEDKADWYSPPREEWGVNKPYRFYVLSTYNWKKHQPDIPLEHFILRNIQLICMQLVLKKEWKSRHLTRSCLFDFNRFPGDLQFFIKSDYICDDCISSILQADEIPKGYRKGFLDEFQNWLAITLPEAKPIKQNLSVK